MQNIINPGPKKIFLRRQIKITGHCLEQVDQPEYRVEATYRNFVTTPQYNQTKHPERDVKYVIRGSATGETHISRHEEAGDANQNKEGRENRQSYEVYASRFYLNLLSVNGGKSDSPILSC
jgi:hypothetical protein